MRLLLSLLFAACCLLRPAWAADELAIGAMPDGTTVPYILTKSGDEKPRYAIVLMPGGDGILAPRMSNGRLGFAGANDFLIRSRALFGTGPFVAASIDATSKPIHILAIAADLQKRFGPLAGYVIGTSRSTEATMALSAPLDGKVTGFIHTSSMGGIAFFDTRKFRSRHLIVLNRLDTCRLSLPAAGQAAHRDYGTNLIVMAGGRTVGDDCAPDSQHGFSGIEALTVEKIQAWILDGK
jgi:hypothetical protein